MEAKNIFQHLIISAATVFFVGIGSLSHEVRSEPGQIIGDQQKKVSGSALEFPESVVWDKANNAWYVSNFGGTKFADKSGMAPVKADGNGFITRMSAKGEIETLRWIAGLHAPKALGIFNGKLYAADVGQLVIMDIASAKIERIIRVPDAPFLNGLAVDPINGDIYISEMMANRIYRFSQETNNIEVFLESTKLEMPNGLHLDGNTLVVGAWGMITNPATFGTKVKGRIKRINLETKSISNVGDIPTANIDGIVKYGETYFITDWVAGKLMKISSDGSATVLKDGFNHSADIGFDPDRKIIAIPEMTPSGQPGRVSFYFLD